MFCRKSIVAAASTDAPKGWLQSTKEDSTAGLPNICEQCLSQESGGSTLQASKTSWVLFGLGVLVFDRRVLKEAECICERLSGKMRGRNCTLQRLRGHRLALAPSTSISLPQRLSLVTVRLDFRASASASQGHAGSKLQAVKTPWAPPGFSTFVSDSVVSSEIDDGDGTVGLQGICECL